MPARDDDEEASRRQRLQASPRPGRRTRLPVAALALAGVALVCVVGGALVYLLTSAPVKPSRYAIPSDAPLAIGDYLSFHPRPNESCDTTVAAAEPGGRVLVRGCSGGGEFVSVDRAMLSAPTYAFSRPEGGDVVLHRAPDGWRRCAVTGLDSGEQVRARDLESEAEVSVAQSKLLVMRPARRESYARDFVPLPTAAPLAPGDLVLLKDGGVLVDARVEVVDGEQVRVQRGFVEGGTFRPDGAAAVEARPRSTLRVKVLDLVQPVRAGGVLLVDDRVAWRRVEVVRELEHHALAVREPGGGPERRVSKVGALRLSP